MKQPANNILSLLARQSKTALMTMATLLLLAIAGIFAVVWLSRSNQISIEQNDRIDITPTQIRTIENIGQWEFLAVSDEEIVDTIRHGFFGDDQLVRIYYGTLRLGIDLHEARPGWMKSDGDTIIAMLPPVKLLNHDFIDEARSRAFYQEGKWSEDAREALYHKAYQAMKKRCLTPENVRNAQRNAAVQFENMLRSMGFKYVRIRFEADESAKQHNKS